MMKKGECEVLQTRICLFISIKSDLPPFFQILLCNSFKIAWRGKRFKHRNTQDIILTKHHLMDRTSALLWSFLPCITIRLLAKEYAVDNSKSLLKITDRLKTILYCSAYLQQMMWALLIINGLSGEDPLRLGGMAFTHFAALMSRKSDQVSYSSLPPSSLD